MKNDSETEMFGRFCPQWDITGEGSCYCFRTAKEGLFEECFRASNPGKYVFVLRVSDGQDHSGSDRVFVQVRESKKPR